MPSFRQRPLMWLFFIALACLNVVALAGDFQTDWYSDLIVAQTFIAAGWLALGHAHRLARAGVLVAVLLASVLPDYFWDQSGAHSNTWRYMLGSLIVLAAAAVASCWLWMFVARLLTRQHALLADAWRFSVAEILGWMILVAVGSVVAPQAIFTHLDEPYSYWVHLTIASAVAGLLMTLFLYRSPLGDLAGGAIAMVAVAAAAVYFSRLAPLSDYMSLLRAYVVLGAWILVLRLDERLPVAATTAAAEAPQSLRVFDPESDDQRRLG